MKKVLFGVGAVAATVFAAKKMIDKEMEKEYIENLEKQWEEEANFETFSPEEENANENVEEIERIFAESENPDLSENLWEKTKHTVKNLLEALPKVTISINVEDKKSQNEDE